ncbi:MAG: amidohydrolase, partial [Betaproteobacteria bacterium]|nr:amidohydrolase [Betaproteobacteria bacterium]
WSITGIGNSPIPIWADSKGKFFGFTQGVGWLPEAYVGEQQRMEDTQAAALASQTEAISKSFLKAPIGTVAFVNVRMFDADNLKFLSGQTIVVDKGKIAAVGPADAIKVPAGAKVIDGKGMTLVPGMWDCHMHVGDDYTGLQELSLGITSIRDPGNNDKLTMDRRARVAAGKLLMPKVHASSLIDGEGPYAAQVANIARSQDDAIKLVQQAKKNGFTGVKFYGTFNPAWLPAATQEAHKLGLHVHGHIPAGIRPMDAINAGYDEVTHINWVIMQAMPESVIKVSNGMMRFEGPGRYSKDVDLDAAPMQTIISAMAKKHIYSDATSRPPTHPSSAPCRLPPNAASAPAALRYPRT